MAFYDTHLHLFNSAHIPLYATLKRFTKKGFDPALVIAGGGISLFALIGKDDNMVRRYEPFLRYFDRKVQDNVEQIVEQIKKAVGTNANRLPIILTPLVLDLEKAEPEKRLQDQVDDLLDGIRLYHERHPGAASELRILPFVGLDLRRFEAGMTETKIEQTLDTLVSQGALHPLKGLHHSDLKSGQCIGLKIYPLLGMNPAAPEYQAVFKVLEQRQIPITVHCQPDGYELGDADPKDLRRYTSPASWRGVLIQHPNLRINFGHFGGDLETRKTIRWEGPDEAIDGRLGNFCRGLNRSTWTYQIIELLRCFPNTYADISAFNYTDQHAKASLRWLLSWDQNPCDDWLIDGDRLPGRAPAHHLVDKLLWGSDYPMPLDSKYGPDYKTIWSDFNKAIGVQPDPSLGEMGPDVPKLDKYPDPSALVEKFTSTNPQRFLFG